ncbi:MAG TPA: PH domain-containing protein, partial [Dehalococcoidia bacterium]|nr:PH domain-containing protein [Dehalococcoidia bacterium]
MIFAPPRTRAPWILAAVAGVAFALGAGLLARGATQAVSFAALLAYSAGAVLVVASLPLAYWAYAAATLRYELRRDTLLVRWGVVEHVLPVRAIERAVLGRHLPLPEVSGLRLPGLLIGTTYVSRVGRASVYLRTQAPQSVVYLITSAGAVGLALDDPQSFVQALARAERDAIA